MKLVIAFVPGFLLPVPAVVPFRDHPAGFVIVPFARRIPGRHFKRFPVQIVLNPADHVLLIIDLMKLVVAFAACLFIPVSVVIPLDSDPARLIILPFYDRIAGSGLYRLAVQKVINPAGPVLLVECLMNLVISFIPGHLRFVRTIVPLRDRVLVFVEFPFNPEVCIACSNRHAFRIEPCFARVVAAVQVGPVDPVASCPHIYDRLPAQSEIGGRSRKPVFPDGIPDDMVSVCRQYPVAVFIKEFLFRGLSVFIRLPDNERVSG